jgi:hypothetical protein
MITTNLGALPETCAEYAEYVSYGGDREDLVTRFGEAILRCVNRHHDPGTNFMLRDQMTFFNEFYSWERRKGHWQHFFNRMINMSQSTESAQTPQSTIIQGMRTDANRSGTTLLTPPIDIAPGVAPAAAEPPKPTRRVMIGTPSYDGKIDVWYVNSMYETMMYGAEHHPDVWIRPIWVSYDSMIQRARNDVLWYFREGGFDDLIMIDSDVEWKPEWFFRLLEHPVDVVGGTYPKKGDLENYVVRHTSQAALLGPNGLLKVDGLGTGFLKFSRRAIDYLWQQGAPYVHNGKQQRWAFDIRIQGGDIISEDIDACNKLRAGGFDIWLDLDMTCNHMGGKKYQGDFRRWFASLPEFRDQMPADTRPTPRTDLDPLYTPISVIKQGSLQPMQPVPAAPMAPILNRGPQIIDLSKMDLDMRPTGSSVGQGPRRRFSG